MLKYIYNILLIDKIKNMKLLMIFLIISIKFKKVR